MFENLSCEQVHSVVRNNAKTEEDICNYFLDAQLFDSEQIKNNILIEAEDYLNPYAMYMLALWYKSGIYVGESIELYESTLKDTLKLLEKRVNETSVDYVVDDGIVIESKKVNAIKESEYGQLSRKICYSLGLFYAGMTETEKLDQAEILFEKTLVNNDMLLSIGTKRRFLAYINGFNKIKNKPQTLFEIFVNEMASLDELPEHSFDTIKKEVKGLFSDVSWSKLHAESKKYMYTSLYSFFQLLEIGEENYSEIDFSGVVSLIMRALEYELKLRFFNQYIDYLRNHREYRNVRNYVSANNLLHRDVSNLRRALIFKDRNNQLRYTNYRTHGFGYTLGSVSPSMGYEKDDIIINIDNTFMDFCKNQLFSSGFSEDDIKNRLSEICENVEKSTDIRNKASHGGNVLNLSDARGVFNDLLFIQKLIDKIVSVCR